MYEVLKKFEGDGGRIFKPEELVDASEWRMKTQLVAHRYIAVSDQSPTPPSPVLKVEATAVVIPEVTPEAIPVVEVVAEVVIPKVTPKVELQAATPKVTPKVMPKVTPKVKLQAVGKKTAKRGRPPLGKKGRGSKEVNNGI